MRPHCDRALRRGFVLTSHRRIETNLALFPPTAGLWDGAELQLRRSSCLTSPLPERALAGFFAPSANAAVRRSNSIPSTETAILAHSNSTNAASPPLLLLIGAAMIGGAMTSAGIAPPSNCDNGSADTSNTVMPAASAAAVASIPTDGGAKIPKESRDEASNGQGAAADLDTAPALQASSDDVVADDHKLFYGQCLKRQMHQPNVPYPAWDYNWDQRMTEATTLESLRTVSGLLNSRRRGTVRHVLLVRHGQYDETSSDDRDRVLTPLGRVQAHRTGLRLMQLAQGNLASLGLIGDSPCHFTKLHVSDMQRAKETAQIIASYLVPTVPAMQVLDPDPMLNEALPSPMIPVRPDIRGAEAEIDANHDRIEAAFAKYIYRAANPDSSDPAGQDVEVLSNGEGVGSNSGGDESDQDGEAVLDVGLRHEFEVIVGHGNVIRYFVCRGLQIPPEAWLRFSVFNCSITYLVISPSGYVSVRSLGDTGHLSYEETTFSGSHGYNW